MSDKTIGVGIIGCGVIAPTHIESYQQIDGVTVLWVCDIDKAKAQKLAEKYSIPNVTDDLNEVYADGDVDVVSICTDHAAHADQVVLAFEAGKHVMCEKALGATNEQLDKMINAHAVHESCLFGGIFQHRFDGVNRVLKGLIDDGTLGTILTGNMQLRCFRSAEYYSDYWHGTWSKEGGGVLINQAIHQLDMINWIMGGMTSIMAHYDNLAHQGQIEVEDTLAASVRYASGALGTLEAISGSNINWEYTLAVHGTKGGVELRNGKPIKVQFADEQTTQKVREALERADDVDGVAGKSYYGTSHPAQIADMIDAVREGREPVVTGESAAQTVRIVLAAYESHQTGKRVELAPAPAAV